MGPLDGAGRYLAGIFAALSIAGAHLLIGDGLGVSALALAVLPDGQEDFEEHLAGLAAVRGRAPT